MDPDPSSEQAARPEVLVFVSEEFPPGFEDDFVEDLSKTGANAVSLRTPRGPFAGLELYLPTAVGIFIASSYFGGAFKKAGENHFEALTHTAKRLYRRVRGIRVTAVGTEGKVAQSQAYSLTYSIVGEVAPRLSFKLILQTQVAEAAAEQGIAAFLDLIRDIHEGAVSEEDLTSLLTHRPVGGVVLVTFDAERRRMVPVDPQL